VQQNGFAVGTEGVPGDSFGNVIKDMDPVFSAWGFMAS